MALTRADVPENKKWDLSSFFKDEKEIEILTDEVKKAIPLLKAYDKKLTVENAHECLKLQSGISRKIERLYVYTNLKRDENAKDAKYQAMTEKMDMLITEFSEAASFISPQLSKLPEKELKRALTMPEYQNFTVMIEEIIREKKHILSDKEEKILSQTTAFSGDFRTVFTMFDNADVHFEPITDKDGNKIELSHGTYALMLQNPDQETRRKAFEAYYKGYTSMLSTIAATYAGSVKKDCAYAKIRKYKSALNSALESDSVSDRVYNNLITAVKKATPAVHKYVALRKKALKLKELHMYDMYVPITAEAKLSLPYEEAYALVIEALQPLGEKYVALLKEAYDCRWIDVEETQNKRSGAYSWGCYDSKPVVLLNYQPTTHDVFTIAHEMGHALHTYMSKHAQCYEKADYSIFVAEIASTVNEVLLIKHLLKTAEGDMRKFLLSYYLDMFRTTLFRQTMFAEFEKYAHAEIESGNPLTAEGMSAKYLEMNQEYYGAAVVHDEQISKEWMRIPHFYRAFYVYKYATGLTSAVNVAKKILTEEGFVEKYYKFLSAGCSLRPLEILKIADVDLSSKEPFDVAMDEFKATLKELQKTIK